MAGLIMGTLLAGPGMSQPPSTTEDAWGALAALRDHLVERGPQRVDFTQTFTPAGFKEGDQEQGEMAIALPDCLRWDYAAPYRKVYLLCGNEVYSWNPGEPSGRRYPVDSERTPGLDLLRMQVEALRQRYVAHMTSEGQHLSVTLTPLQTVSDIRDATFELDPGRTTLIALTYHDQEDGLTSFAFSNYRPLGELDLFSPPSELSWQTD